MDGLTQRQLQILEFLISRWESGANLPTHREICGHFNFASPKAAADHLAALKEKGYLQSGPGLSSIRPAHAKSIGNTRPRRDTGRIVDRDP